MSITRQESTAVAQKDCWSSLFCFTGDDVRTSSSLPIIDWTGVSLESDPKFHLECLNDLLTEAETGDKEFKKVMSNFDKTSFDKIGRIAHKVKGAAACTGCKQLAAVSFEVQVHKTTDLCELSLISFPYKLLGDSGKGQMSNPSLLKSIQDKLILWRKGVVNVKEELAKRK